MKVLFLTHKFYPDIGGIEVNSEILAIGFVKEGHQVRVLTWTDETGERSFPFEIYRNPGIKQLITAHRWADVVFENNPCFRLAWPSFILRKPSVVALRTWINRKNGERGWKDKLKIAFLRRASAVIAVSDEVRKRTWKMATVIGNPYRQELFYKMPEIRKKHDFVFLGRLVSDKGVDLAIMAIYILNSLNVKQGFLKNPLSITIIGEGEEIENLKILVEELKLNKEVKFTGSLRGDKLVKCLNQHRYLLVPSLWEEPFGNVALEGMACGCLPIVSDGGGLPDAVGQAGAVFQRGNLNALIECILNIFSDSEFEIKIRNAATDHLKSHHPDVVVRKYLNIIEEAASKNRIVS